MIKKSIHLWTRIGSISSENYLSRSCIEPCIERGAAMPYEFIPIAGNRFLMKIILIIRVRVRVRVICLHIVCLVLFNICWIHYWALYLFSFFLILFIWKLVKHFWSMWRKSTCQLFVHKNEICSKFGCKYIKSRVCGYLSRFNITFWMSEWVCMYVWYVCMYVYACMCDMYVCVCMCVWYVCMYVWYVCMHVCVYVCMYEWMNECMCFNVMICHGYLIIFIRLCMFACVNVRSSRVCMCVCCHLNRYEPCSCVCVCVCWIVCLHVVHV